MFNIKTWIDRVSEFPTRRLLTKVSDGTSEQVIVSRDEGTVTTAGDTFDANTMNNLEARIASAFTADNQKMGDLADLDTTDKSSLVAAINEAAQGGGGSSTLAGLTDTSINAPTNGQVLTWSSLASKWINANASGGADVSPVIFHLTTSEYFEDATSSSDWTLALKNLDGTGLLDADAKARIEAGAPMYATFTYKSKDSDQLHDWGLYFTMQIFESNILAIRSNDSFVLLAPDESNNYLGYYTAEFEYVNDAYELSFWLNHGSEFPSSDLINLGAIVYDNTTSGMTATDAQAAIDELADEKADTTLVQAAIQTAIEDATHLKAGDVFNLTGGIYAGSITGSSKNVYIFIPLPKGTDNISNVSVSGNWYIRGISGHILSNATLASAGTVTTSLVAGGVQILLEMSTAHSTMTNTPLTALAWTNAKLTFS